MSEESLAHARPLALAIFPNEKTVQPHVFQKPWSEVVRLLGTKELRAKKSGPMLGAYGLTGTRSNANITLRSLIQLDIDSDVERDEATGQIIRVTRRAPDLAEIAKNIGQFEWAASSSYSHNPSKGVIKYRVTMLPDRDIRPEEYSAIWDELNRLLGGCLDLGARSLSQAFYLPSCPLERAADFFFVHNSGLALNVDEFVAKARASTNAFGEMRQHYVPPVSMIAMQQPPQPQVQATGFMLSDVEAALSYIDPDKGGRRSWWSKLAAIGDAFGEAGQPLAESWSRGDLWSQPSTKFDQREFNKQYSDVLSRTDYAGPRTTIPSIFAEAQAAGWSGPQGLPDWLAAMNRSYCWIIRQKAIYRFQERDFIKMSELRDQYSNRMEQVSIAGKTRIVTIAEAWLKDARRRDHDALSFAPGQPEIVDTNTLNTWRGFATTPSPGAVQPFLDLLRWLVPDRDVAGYLIQWMAHLVQHPGVKMHVAPVIWSNVKGVGKNLLFECLLAMIGSDHSILIEQADLARDFNAWAREKVLVIGDEVIGNDRRLDADKLKGLITGATIHINEKHQPVVEVRNLANFIFLSNHANALFIDEHERRYLVWEVEAGPLSLEQIEQFRSWRDSGGIAALLHLLMRIPLTDFKAKAPAPKTTARAQMIAANRSDLELWAEVITTSTARQAIGREIATAQELALRYTSDTGHKISAKAVNNAFKGLGAHQFDHQVRLPDGRKVRAFAIDRTGFWKAQQEAAWACELSKSLRL